MSEAKRTREEREELALTTLEQQLKTLAKAIADETEKLSKLQFIYAVACKDRGRQISVFDSGIHEQLAKCSLAELSRRLEEVDQESKKKKTAPV